MNRADCVSVYGFCRVVWGDCDVANARQGTTLSRAALPALGAFHSPPGNAADRFATRTPIRNLL
ncbi:hypothetical protein [Noviherbaspirillum saxi]|uniref:hypothetical protein n=1 Tax=Noviherbaspirillum saxi TaxID=2320863 RepID=UPI0011C376DC|nr:hypothetical protein [Noviherbaspirillum saxi]